MTKQWKFCNHENLYSQRPRPGEPSKYNGLMRVPGRVDIEVDHCRDCNYWLYEGMVFLTIMSVVGYVDAL